MRRVAWTLGSFVVLLGGCSGGGQPQSPGGPGFEVRVAPLSLPGVTNSCYRLTVTNGPNRTGDIVWQQDDVCADQYGDGVGSITYVGSCDAGVATQNSVTLELLDLESGTPPAPIDDDAYDNPCGQIADWSGDRGALAVGEDAYGPCTLNVTCKENADTPVDFDITVMRDASQGFFDVAVNFEDIFCSAKSDTCYDGDVPIDLLLNSAQLSADASGDGRYLTSVNALACAAAPNTFDRTVLHLSAVTVSCDDGWTCDIDPGMPAGNNTATCTDGEDSEQVAYALYYGNESLDCGAPAPVAGQPASACADVFAAYSDWAGYVGMPEITAQAFAAAVPCNSQCVEDYEAYATVAARTSDPELITTWAPVHCVTPPTCNKVYWNIAINLEDLEAAGLSHCKVAYDATATTESSFTYVSGDLVERNTTYPVVHFDAPLTGAGAAPVCMQDGLDDELLGVTTRYDHGDAYTEASPGLYQAPLMCNLLGRSGVPSCDCTDLPLDPFGGCRASGVKAFEARSAANCAALELSPELLAGLSAAPIEQCDPTIVTKLAGCIPQDEAFWIGSVETEMKLAETGLVGANAFVASATETYLKWAEAVGLGRVGVSKGVYGVETSLKKAEATGLVNPLVELAANETYLKYAEAVGTPRTGQRTSGYVPEIARTEIASVESYLKYAEAVGDTVPGGSTENRVVIAAVETYLKYAEAVGLTNTFDKVATKKRIVVASVETYLKYAEAVGLTSRDVKDPNELTRIVIASVETYLKYAEAVSPGADTLVAALQETYMKYAEAIGLEADPAVYTLGGSAIYTHGFAESQLLALAAVLDALTLTQLEQKGIVANAFDPLLELASAAPTAFGRIEDKGLMIDNGAIAQLLALVAAAGDNAVAIDRILDKGVTLDRYSMAALTALVTSLDGNGFDSIIDKGLVSDFLGSGAGVTPEELRDLASVLDAGSGTVTETMGRLLDYGLYGERRNPDQFLASLATQPGNLATPGDAAMSFLRTGVVAENIREPYALTKYAARQLATGDTFDQVALGILSKGFAVSGWSGGLNDLGWAGLGTNAGSAVVDRISDKGIAMNANANDFGIYNAIRTMPALTPTQVNRFLDLGLVAFWQDGCVRLMTAEQYIMEFGPN